MYLAISYALAATLSTGRPLFKSIGLHSTSDPVSSIKCLYCLAYSTARIEHVWAETYLEGLQENHLSYHCIQRNFKIFQSLQSVSLLSESSAFQHPSAEGSGKAGYTVCCCFSFLLYMRSAQKRMNAMLPSVAAVMTTPFFSLAMVTELECGIPADQQGPSNSAELV